jgi:hypothetical protein
MPVQPLQRKAGNWLTLLEVKAGFILSFEKIIFVLLVVVNLVPV